jgi:hypothetical protein
MNTNTQGRTGSPRALRAGIVAAILTVIGCFGAAIALAHSPDRQNIPVEEENLP